MATEIRWRRGTTAQHSTFVGAPQEVTVDTDLNALVVHDGVTTGGFPIIPSIGLQNQIDNIVNTTYTETEVDVLLGDKLDKDASNVGNATAQASFRQAIGITKWNNRFIGEIVYVDTSLTGVEIPPIDAGFIELTAGLDGSGQYNEGKLTGETIGGSGATLTATAVIDDADSPMNGQTISLINTEERVLYAGERSKSGDVFSDQMQTITGGIRGDRGILVLGGMNHTDPEGAFSAGSSLGLGVQSTAADSAHIEFNSANSPNARTGDRTRAKGQFMVAFLKYKDVA